MTEEMLIGTTPACQVRFNREHFFEDFEIRLTSEEVVRSEFVQTNQELSLNTASDLPAGAAS